jgi:cytidylate kinase
VSEERRRVIVAIDGPAGAGKSTVTRALTQALGYQLLDTGSLYRSVALAARRRQVDWGDEDGLAAVARSLSVRFSLDGDINRVFVDGDEVTEAIRTPEISEGASVVSALPSVRDALLDLQRSIGRVGGVVAEGRDVGTVVFPEAAVKFFLTASDRERAQRRQAELEARGHPSDYDTVLAEIQRRDERDSNRAVAPLRQADDAVLVDSTARSVTDVVAEMEARVRAAEGVSQR